MLFLIFSCYYESKSYHRSQLSWGWALLLWTELAGYLGLLALFAFALWPPLLTADSSWSSLSSECLASRVWVVGISCVLILSAVVLVQSYCATVSGGRRGRNPFICFHVGSTRGNNLSCYIAWHAALSLLAGGCSLAGLGA